jgi:hypothetical protein
MFPLPPELVVMVFFLLSLGAAWVLFKFLSSTAAITKKEYQLGGAAAGCLILYSALYGSYNYLARLQVKAWQQQLIECKKQLTVAENAMPFEGTVYPVPKNAVVVLSVSKINLDDAGRFRLIAKGLDLTKDSVSVYVVGETQHSYLQLFPNDDTLHLKIPFLATSNSGHANETH